MDDADHRTKRFAYNNTRAGRLRLWLLLSLGIITPLGFAAKFYRGLGQGWINNSAVGVLYEIFWCLFLFFFWPRKEWLRKEWLAKICIGTFIVTSLLELLQLWHPPFLEQVRANFIGRTLIGTTFAWLDFPHYLLGCILGWYWINFLIKKVYDGRLSSG